MCPNDDFLGAFHALIDASDMSDVDKRHVKASQWTFDEIPAIGSAEQYEEYRRLSDELAAGLPHKDDPAFIAALAEWSRSREGMLSNVYAARMLEWEELRGGKR